MFNFLKKHRNNKLYCFSPEVMLATFFIELILCVGMFIYRKVNRVNIVGVFILIGLGVFQLSEYLVCEQGGGMLFSKIGFVFITFLPPLGVHLVNLVRGRDFVLTKISYFLSFIVAYIILSGSLISESVCAGNYVIFHMYEPFGLIFSVYYLSILALGIILACMGMKESLKIGEPKNYKTFFWFIVGYLSFLLPTGLVYLFLGVSNNDGGSSIMCGFALVLAFIIYYKIAPLQDKS